MAAVTRAQEAEYLAQLEKEAPAKPPEDVEPPAPQPQRPAVSPSFAGARPLPPPPPIRKLPPLGRLGQPARPGTPIVSPPSLDTDTRSAIVPEPPVAPLPARPPTSPEVTATTASRSIDITTKPGDDRPSAVAPYSARKTLEVPIDRALIDATLAAASTRATVELLPTPAPAAVAPAPAPSRPTLEIDSPFDSGWDDLEPPATPVREVAPELVEEAAGLGPSGKTK
jgi:hypothetical protein